MAQRERGAAAADRSTAQRQPVARDGDLAALRARLRGVVEPVVRATGYYLEDLSVSRAGRRHVIRVVVDGEAGVSLDAVAEVSRAVSQALDEAEASNGAFSPQYTLEVSSPGVDRPLSQPRHWRRSIGRLVKVSVAGTVLTGRVRRVDESGVTLEVDGSDRDIPMAELGPGRVQVEFARLAELTDDDFGDEFDDGADESADDELDGDDEEGKDGS